MPALYPMHCSVLRRLPPGFKASEVSDCSKGCHSCCEEQSGSLILAVVGLVEGHGACSRMHPALHSDGLWLQGASSSSKLGWEASACAQHVLQLARSKLGTVPGQSSAGSPEAAQAIDGPGVDQAAAAATEAALRRKKSEARKVCTQQPAHQHDVCWAWCRRLDAAAFSSCLGEPAGPPLSSHSIIKYHQKHECMQPTCCSQPLPQLCSRALFC